MTIYLHVIPLAPIKTIADPCQNSSVCPSLKNSVYDYFVFVFVFNQEAHKRL